MFQKAQKNVAKLRVAVAGTAGSGKTFSALRLAKGIGGKIAVIDTEHGSASLYADRFEFDVLNMTPPFTPEKYVEAIKAAEKNGYEIIVIDSLSHAWAGEGGLLDIHDKIARASKSGNSFNAWRDVTPMHNQLVEAMLQSGCHVIATMRSKTEYIMEEVERNGRKTTIPKKVGLAPIQRDGMEYEFTLCLDISQEHIASASKDRTSIFDNKYFTVTEETGTTLKNWLNGDIKPAAPAQQSAPKNETKPETKTEKATEEKKEPAAAPSPSTASAPTATEEPKKWLWNDIVKVLTPELKALFSARITPTAIIKNYFDVFDGDQTKIIEAIKKSEKQEAAA